MIWQEWKCEIKRWGWWNSPLLNCQWLQKAPLKRYHNFIMPQTSNYDTNLRLNEQKCIFERFGKVNTRKNFCICNIFVFKNFASLFRGALYKLICVLNEDTLFNKRLPFLVPWLRIWDLFADCDIAWSSSNSFWLYAVMVILSLLHNKPLGCPAMPGKYKFGQ